jgi:hypothetical protein
VEDGEEEPEFESLSSAERVQKKTESLLGNFGHFFMHLALCFAGFTRVFR